MTYEYSEANTRNIDRKSRRLWQKQKQYYLVLGASNWETQENAEPHGRRENGFN